MVYFSKDTMQKVKSVDLLTYLLAVDPGSVRQRGADTYCLVEHDSLVISNGLWNWFSQGFGGKNALDYLMKVKKLTFVEAVNDIISRDLDFEVDVSYQVTKPPVKRELVLPEFSSSTYRAFKYLTRKRGIDPEIVNYCIDKDLIKQSAGYPNVVFLGYDDSNVPRYAHRRGIYSNFKLDARGSDKRYSFRLNSQSGSSYLYVFEAAIDCLSFATFAKMRNKNWKNMNLLSLSGVNKSMNNAAGPIPPALSSFLNKNKEITKIILVFDNDEVGRAAAQSLRDKLKSNYEVSLQFPLHGKDVNDHLLYIRKHKELSR